MDVVLLTKNLSNEEPTIKKLELLNYGYFCSTHLVDNLLNQAHPDLDVFKHFPICFFSNTLDNQEVEKIASILASAQKTLFRLHDNSNDYESIKLEQSFVRKIWIHSEIDMFREELARAKPVLKKNNLSPTDKNYFNVLRTLNISQKAKVVLELLIANYEKVVSRENIVEQIWGEKTTARYSQLSFLITVIRGKIQEEGLNFQIKSKWGQGYQLLGV